MPKRFRKIQIFAIFSFLTTLIVIAAGTIGDFSSASFAAHAGSGSIGTAALLVFLFGIKSLTIVVPLVSLYVASGMIFEPIPAVAVSYLGLAVTFTVPYILGHWIGREELEYIRMKYPKIRRILEIQKKNEFLAAFLVRLIGWLPCDVISLYFGACSTRYPVYLTASLLGSMISVVTNTLLGDVLRNPLSKEFAVLMIVKVLISASAVILAWFLNRGGE